MKLVVVVVAALIIGLQPIWASAASVSFTRNAVIDAPSSSKWQNGETVAVTAVFESQLNDNLWTFDELISYTFTGADSGVVVGLETSASSTKNLCLAGSCDFLFETDDNLNVLDARVFWGLEGTVSVPEGAPTLSLYNGVNCHICGPNNLGYGTFLVDQSGGTNPENWEVDPSTQVVPLPAAAWLFLSVLGGGALLRRKSAKAA